MRPKAGSAHIDICFGLNLTSAGDNGDELLPCNLGCGYRRDSSAALNDGSDGDCSNKNNSANDQKNLLMLMRIVSSPSSYRLHYALDRQFVPVSLFLSMYYSS